MKGVICAGGTGSRLGPLTKVVNKHLLPVGTSPMIYHPIRTLVSAGITDIIVIVGGASVAEIIHLLGNGETFRASITYKYQDKPLGIPHAVGLARDFVRRDRFVVILGDNIIEDDIRHEVDAFLAQPDGTAKILLKPVESPEQYGILSIDGEPPTMVEKPEKPPSHLAVTGIYMFDAHVFTVIPHLSPSERGEFEMADIINTYFKQGACTYSVLQGYWFDAGTFEGYTEANLELRKSSCTNCGEGGRA